jgi:hypothetical protein
MILKVVMPQVNRFTHGGVTIKWHKREGEFVGYGDDIVDVEMCAEDRSVKSLKERINKLTEGTQTETDSLLMSGEAENETGISVCITSSDAGVIRRIHAEEGEYKGVGDLLAVITTDADESVEGVDETLADAVTFRVVPNIIFK